MLCSRNGEISVPRAFACPAVAARAGFTVLRFRNEIVLTSPSQVFEAIRAVADKASFSP